METKWYSDFKELCISPFKTGIPQIVAYGSCMKGFYGAAAVSVVGSLLTTFYTGSYYIDDAVASYILWSYFCNECQWWRCYAISL